MGDMQRWTVREPYLNVKCSLGEGPFYSEERNELRFMDINNHQMFFIDLSKGPNSVSMVDTTIPVGVTADINGRNDILVGAKDGVTKFDPSSGKHEYIAKFWGDDTEKAKKMRANDGAVDSSGRFWVEAFNEPLVTEPKEEGVLFRMDLDGGLHTILEKMTIPNGISWNAQEDTMFLTDSPTQNVYAFDYDSKSGNISNRRIFYHHDEEGVFPDGHAMDVEGYIWHACYGGSKVIRISPEGKVVGEISLPTRNITCPAFAGTKLFITSAEEKEKEKYPESAKFGGNLFMVDVGIRGMPKHKAGLS